MFNSLLIIIVMVIIVMCNGRQRFKPGSSVTGSAGGQMAFSIMVMMMMLVMTLVMVKKSVTLIMTDSVNRDSNDVSKFKRTTARDVIPVNQLWGRWPTG